MIKLHLLGNDLEINIVKDSKVQKIAINNGIYNNKRFSDIIFTRNSILLEGDDVELVAEYFAAVYITVKNIREKLYEILKDSSVFLGGVDVIPEGEERKIIEQLMQ